MHIAIRLAMALIMCGIAVAQPGAEVYGTRCASCHGQDGAGKTNAAKTFNGMPDLRTQIQALSNRQLFESIARGTDHKKYPHVFLQMGLTQSDITAIVDHLRTMAKK